MPDRPLHRRIFAHFRGQAVGYIALFFALGGGYAIAATNGKTIHGCVVKKSGELLVKSRCGPGQQRLVWNQQGPAGPSAATAWASVNALGFTGDGTRGLQVTHVSTGVYDVKLTLAKCAMVTTAPQVTVNTAVSPPSYPSSWETFKSRTEFTVQTGVVTGGSFTPTDEAFNTLVPCS